jgi:hypothetical protein
MFRDPELQGVRVEEVPVGGSVPAGRCFFGGVWLCQVANVVRSQMGTFDELGMCRRL